MLQGRESDVEAAGEGAFGEAEGEGAGIAAGGGVVGGDGEGAALDNLVVHGGV